MHITYIYTYSTSSHRGRKPAVGIGSGGIGKEAVGKNYQFSILNFSFTSYIYTPAGLTAMYVKYASSDSLFYLMTDHLGSITMVTRANGTGAETFSYDAWGRRRNPTDLSYNNVPLPRSTSRGYTGHEHLSGVNLINMNGRVYDPVLGLFLSPDPILQDPNNPLNYYRYTYCINNPLKYTDPSGESWGYIALAVFTYLQAAHDNRDKETGKWEWNPIKWFDKDKSGLIVSVSGNSSGNMTYSVQLNLTGQNTSISIGGSTSENYYGYGVDYRETGGYGYGLYSAHYGFNQGPDGNSNSQNLGGVKIHTPYASIRLENDFLGDEKDRWRTNALEMEIYLPGNRSILIGSYIYTNSPVREKSLLKRDDIYASRYWKKRNTLGTYTDGEVYKSPFWVGMRYGGKVTRIGYDNPKYQDIQQNGMHLFLVKSPLFYTPYGKYSKWYFYNGYYDFYSLY